MPSGTQNGVVTTGAQTFAGVKTFTSNPVFPVHTPASSSEAGTAGSICVDASYLYVWTGATTVKRIALTTW